MRRAPRANRQRLFGESAQCVGERAFRTCGTAYSRTANEKDPRIDRCMVAVRRAVAALRHADGATFWKPLPHSLYAIGTAAILGLAVTRLWSRVPLQLRPSFYAIHFGGAAVYAAT